MSYCSPSDLARLMPEAELAQLAGDAPGLVFSHPDVQANLQAAIDAAGQEVDAYLAAAGLLPLATVPGLVGVLASKLAVVGLYRRRRLIELPEVWAKEQASVQRLLERIAAGQLRLVEQAATEAMPLPEQGVAVNAPGRVFGADTWEKFR